MNNLFTADIVVPIIERIENYRRLIKLIELKSVEEGSCSLSHKVIANFLDVHLTDIDIWTKKLIELRLIEQVGSNHTYKSKDFELDGSPLNQLMDLLILLKDSPELSFALQAQSLGISIKELESLFGLMIQIIE